MDATQRLRGRLNYNSAANEKNINRCTDGPHIVIANNAIHSLHASNVLAVSQFTRFSRDVCLIHGILVRLAMAWLNKFSWLLGDKTIKANILLVGLIGSGKSTIMVQLKPPDTKMERLTPSIPLIYHAEKFTFLSLSFVAFDLCEVKGFGNPWEDLYKECDAIIFVVDSSDRCRIPEARHQLQRLLENPLIASRVLPVVCLANKADHPEAVPPLQLSEMLHLQTVCDKPRHAMSCDSLTGEGLGEILDWLAAQLKSTKHVRPRP